MASTKALVLAAILLVACGGPLEICPDRPSHIEGATMQCVSDGCGLGDLRWSALGCEHQMGQWAPAKDCTFQASYLCGNGRTAVVVYGEGWARFTIRAEGCTSTYMLSSEPLGCSAAD